MTIEAKQLASEPSRHWALYRCPNCRRGQLCEASDGECRCRACEQKYSITRNVLDLLLYPSPDVIQELQGTAREQGLPIELWAEMKVARTSEMRDLEGSLDCTRDDPVQYYQQTTANFRQAFDVIAPRLDTTANVLEIGSRGDYYFLKPFAERGAACFSTNIGYYFKEPDPYLEWPEKTLADMNDLPFVEGAFDFVVISATSHHSPNLERTVAELSRVTKRGGAVLMVNDPLKGLLKNLGGTLAHGHGRDELIHENEFTLWRYHRSFVSRGFEPQYLFSKFHDDKLRSAQIHPDMRFATIARQVARAWQVPAVRSFAQKRLLWLAQTVFGFPLNVVLWRQ